MAVNKKIKDQRLRAAVCRHEDFLTQRLSDEWDRIERQAKKEAIVQYAKSASAVVAKTLLVLLLIAGTATIAAVAPNMFAAAGRLMRRRVFFAPKGMNTARAYLKKNHFITEKKDQNGHHLELTVRGRTRALLTAFQELKVTVQPQWDAIWRVIIFDIPEEKRWSRDTFRNALRTMGFVQLQKSVFVTPYPCEKEVEFLTAICDVPGRVRLIRTREIIHDHDLRELFSLQ